MKIVLDRFSFTPNTDPFVERVMPFDESKFEPMPEVDINPKDEFWVDPGTLDSST